MESIRPKRKDKKTENIDADSFTFGSRVLHTKTPKKVESRLVILDYLPEGREFGAKRREPIIQGIGDKWFTLLELVPKKLGDYPQFMELELPTEGKESKIIKQIKGKIGLNDLTNTAYNALEEAILKIIEKNERRFVAFFNRAQPITNRIHSLQLIPGIGKKLMWELLNERKKLPFVSFEDIETRVKISDIKKMLAKRIITELGGEEKHRLFTA